MQDKFNPADVEATTEKGQTHDVIETVVDPSNDKALSNSKSRSFDEILAVRASRRAVLGGGIAAAGAVFATESVAGNWWNRARVLRRSPKIDFDPLTISQYIEESAIDGVTGRIPAISKDYQFDVILPWGTPLENDTPTPAYEGDPNSRPTSTDQSNMIGLGHDGMWFFPTGYRKFQDGDFNEWCAATYKPSLRGRRCIAGHLVINHEFGTNPHALGKSAPETLEDVRLSQSVHGVSVVALVREGEFREQGQWRQTKSDTNRRITVNSPVAFSGPAAHSELLQNPAGNPTLGTVNNCANGYTPWGTYLTCEENFNGYFGARGAQSADDFTPAEGSPEERYGFDWNGFGYGWYEFDDRFDLTNDQYINERNRFGWVVEIDPENGHDVPVKRTAMGRCKHEGVAATTGAGGRVVCYMGDDQFGDYIYKYVSEDSWRRMFRKGRHPLDHGTLYVMKLEDDGSGEWLELSPKNPALSDKSIDWILVYTRLAADIVGATPLPRAEWTTTYADGTAYATLTAGDFGQFPELPPSGGGYILSWKDTNKFVGKTFHWDIFATGTAGDEVIGDDDVSTFTGPDGLWADPDGRLFIQTDASQADTLVDSPDPNSPPEPVGILQDQMLVADRLTGEIKRLFAGVNSDEITGVTMTPDRRTMFINIQHPGNGDPTRTNFPLKDGENFTFDGVTIPRDCTVVITKKDGGLIGQ